MKPSSVELVKHYCYCDVREEELCVTGELAFYIAVGGARLFSLDKVCCGQESPECPHWKKCSAKQEALSIWRKRVRDDLKEAGLYPK